MCIFKKATKSTQVNGIQRTRTNSDFDIVQRFTFFICLFNLFFINYFHTKEDSCIFLKKYYLFKTHCFYYFYLFLFSVTVNS